MQPPFASHAGTDWVLVTGQPGCGKTTAVKKLVDELRASGESVRGFYTDEVLQGGRRVGFDIVSVPDGRRGPLARKGAAGPKVGAYGVDVAGFERLALPTLDVDDDDETIYVLDEIGRMELKSDAFAARVEELLARGVRLVGAITAPIYGHRVALTRSPPMPRSLPRKSLVRTMTTVGSPMAVLYLRPAPGQSSE